MIDQRRPLTGLRRPGVVGLLLVAMLGACTSPSRSGGLEASAGTGPAAMPSLPPDTVQVGPDLYQVPIGVDADGCRMYRLHSPTRLVVEAVFYRRLEGGFTHDKRAADCDRSASGGRSPASGAGPRARPAAAAPGGAGIRARSAA